MRKILILFLLSLYISIYAAIPTGYYNSADGKNTGTLQSALQIIISNGTTDIGYGGLWTAYATTDLNSSGKIWDMYSNCSYTYSAKQCGSYSSECDCYNREHTSPQSWFNSASPMVSDLFNVYPTDGKVNGERGNYPYGEVGTATYTSGNGCKLGISSFSGYAGVVFEPIDEYKGDFARTYFYMATRYASVCQSWSSGAEVVYGANLGLTTYAMNLFLKWSREDPVSAKELARNEAVYKIQNNRNPFIDYPGLEEYIWGNKANAAFSTTGSQTPYLSTPSSGTTLDFGKVAFQQTDTASVYIQGVNLTGDLTLALSGTNASYFSLPTNTITKDAAQAGYKLIVNYTAQAIGTQTALLTITGGGITSTSVTLTATATDGFIALPASNISSSGFTANWTSSSSATGYLLDVYSLTGNSSATSKTLLSEDFLSVLPSTWTSTPYFDNSTASNIKLGSGKQAGSITTPPLDLSTNASTLTVNAKQWGTDAAAYLTVKVNSDSITTFLTTADYQYFAVNIPVKTSTSTISLSVLSGSGHRVYVDYVEVITQGIPLVPVSVVGFPVLTGNVLNYTVNNLQSDSIYYYTVTPQGNSTTISDPVKVKTISINNAIKESPTSDIYWHLTSNGIQLGNLSAGSNIRVFDMMGKHVTSNVVSSSESNIVLQQRGIYFLQVQKNTELTSFKIIY